MQTHLRRDASGDEVAVGHTFDQRELTTRHLVGAGYALINEPDSATLIRLLDVWACTACSTEQWARIDIVARRLDAIEAVTLDRVSFEAAHFISSVNAEQCAAGLVGVPPYELAAARADSIAILRQRLG